MTLLLRLLQPFRSMCLFAARTLVGLSLKDRVRYDVLSELRLRTRTEFGDRVAQGFVPLGEFTDLESCATVTALTCRAPW